MEDESEPRYDDGSLVERPLDGMGASLAWLGSALRSAGVDVHPASKLALALRTLEDFRRRALAQEKFAFDSSEEAYAYFACANGADFLSKALHWGHAAGLRIPAQRWRHLASGDPLITRPAQHSNERNFTWEVLIASLSRTFATDVSFEEPDVTCSYGGRRFGVAAKVLYSRDKVWSNIKKGAQQASAGLDASLVFVDVVGELPLVDVFRESRRLQFRGGKDAAAWAKQWAQRWCGALPLNEIGRKLRDRVSNPLGVAFFMPMVLVIAEQPACFFYVHMPLRWAAAESPDYDFTRSFLHACNHVLGFRGDSAVNQRP